MNPNTPPLPGWYPDPAGGPIRKYWDGAAWHDGIPDTPAAPPTRPKGRKLLIAAVVVLGLMALGNINGHRHRDTTTTTGAARVTSTAPTFAKPDAPKFTPDEIRDAEYSALLMQRGVQFTAAGRDDLILQGHVVCVYLKQDSRPTMLQAGAGLMTTYGHDEHDAAAIATSAVDVYCPDMKP